MELRGDPLDKHAAGRLSCLVQCKMAWQFDNSQDTYWPHYHCCSIFQALFECGGIRCPFWSIGAY